MTGQRSAAWRSLASMLKPKAPHPAAASLRSRTTTPHSSMAYTATEAPQQPTNGWLHGVLVWSQELASRAVDTALRPLAATERFWAGLLGAVSGGSQASGRARRRLTVTPGAASCAWGGALARQGAVQGLAAVLLPPVAAARSPSARPPPMPGLHLLRDSYWNCSSCWRRTCQERWSGCRGAAA